MAGAHKVRGPSAGCFAGLAGWAASPPLPDRDPPPQRACQAGWTADSADSADTPRSLGVSLLLHPVLRRAQIKLAGAGRGTRVAQQLVPAIGAPQSQKREEEGEATARSRRFGNGWFREQGCVNAGSLAEPGLPCHTWKLGSYKGGCEALSLSF